MAYLRYLRASDFRSTVKDGIIALLPRSCRLNRKKQAAKMRKTETEKFFKKSMDILSLLRI